MSTLHSKIDAMIINRPNRFVLHTQTVDGAQEVTFPTALELMTAAKQFAANSLFGQRQRPQFDMMYVQSGHQKWTWTPSDYNELRGLEQTPNFRIWRAA